MPGAIPQLKTRPPTDILQKPHPDLELYLYVLEIHEHLFSKKLALNGCFLKRRRKKKTKTKKEQQQQQQQHKITKKSK